MIGSFNAMPDQSSPTPAELRLAAMNLLARREHSSRELEEKLLRRFGDVADIRDPLEAALAGLKRDGLQSDERFAEAFVTMRQRQGKGPLRIAQELRLKGIADDLIATCLDSLDEEVWLDLAKAVRAKRFGSQSAESPRERVRQVRFLQYRGFTHEQIRASIEG